MHTEIFIGNKNKIKLQRCLRKNVNRTSIKMME